MATCPHDEELLDALYADYAGPLLDYVQRVPIPEATRSRTQEDAS